jgi:diacylglycerol kinase
MKKFLTLLKSFKYAGRGAAYVFYHEQNFRLQLLAGIVTVAAMFFFGLRRSEMVVILLLIFLVLILELVNSALEKFIDLIKPRLSFQAEVIKDIMAAMVMLASFAALLIGLIIFWPYLRILIIR